MTKVLISRGYGAGWSTWCYGDYHQAQFMLTYEPIIRAIENGEKMYADIDIEGEDHHPAIKQMLADFKEKWPQALEPYLGGAEGLCVEEVKGLFRVNEYDGAESVEIRDEQDWYLGV